MGVLITYQNSPKGLGNKARKEEAGVRSRRAGITRVKTLPLWRILPSVPQLLSSRRVPKGTRRCNHWRRTTCPLRGGHRVVRAEDELGGSLR